MVESDNKKGRTTVVVLVALVLAALLTSGLYVMSLRNHDRYRLVVAQGQLLIERGRMMPSGFEAFVPTDAALQLAYEALQVHAEAKALREVYDDRIALDKAMFLHLTAWLRQATESQSGVSMDDAQRYLSRARLIPSLVDEQLRELQRLEADLAYRKGRAAVDRMEKLRQEAQLSFKRALDLGTRFRSEAEQSLIQLSPIPVTTIPQVQIPAPEVP